MELKITAENFESEVLKSDKPVLIDFWAPWCGPCRRMGAVVAEIAKEEEASLKVGKVNVDEEGDLAQKFGIMSIPAFLLFKNGEVVAQTIGGQSKETLVSFVKQ